MATCAKWKVPIVITSLGAIVEVNQAVHGWGGITLHDIINDRFARKAIEKGADGVIAVAAGRRRPCRHAVALRLGPGDPAMVRRAADPVGRDRHRPRHPRRPGDGRRPRLYRLAVHRHRRGQCRRGLQAGHFDGRAADIVYSSLFTGVHGNYLRASIVASGLDPDNLPEGDLKTMNFGGGESAKKAWRDIWGSGQGIGAIDRVRPAGDYVAELIRQYEEAKAELCA